MRVLMETIITLNDTGLQKLVINFGFEKAVEFRKLNKAIGVVRR